MWGPNASFYDEAEKVAALAPLAAGATAGVVSGLAAHHFVRDAGQTDRLLHALGSMSAKELEERRRRRRMAVGGTAATVGGVTAAAYNPARRAAAKKVALFTKKVVRPTVADIEDRAARASKHIARDIGEDISGRISRAQQEFVAGAASAGENYGQGLATGLRSRLSVLGRVLLRAR